MSTKLQSRWITKAESSQMLTHSEFHHIIERPFPINEGYLSNNLCQKIERQISNKEVCLFSFCIFHSLLHLSFSFFIFHFPIFHLPFPIFHLLPLFFFFYFLFFIFHYPYSPNFFLAKCSFFSSKNERNRFFSEKATFFFKNTPSENEGLTKKLHFY